MATSKYLIDVFVRHQVYLERLKAGLVGEFDPTIRKIDKAILAALADAGVASVNELGKRELTQLINTVKEAETKLLSEYAEKLSTDHEQLANYESQFAEKALDHALVSPPTLVKLDAGTAWAFAKTQPVQATGQLLKPYTDSMVERNVLKVEAVIRNAHAQGWTVGQTVTAIRGTKKNNYADGLLDMSRRDVESMVRTSVQHVSNAARAASWEANDDIVEGYRWISTLDSRTTQQCRSLDHRVFELGKGPRPPIHIRCRSTTVPEIAETAKLLGGGTTRASKGAEGGQQVPANQTYYEWLRGQPATFQDTAIGPVRGKLFREGGLSADEFARLNLNRQFEPMTLDEMKKLAPEAFNRAGL